LVFLLGETDDKEAQKKLETEADLYRDIVQVGEEIDLFLG
jgi:hypothetical protein